MYDIADDARMRVELTVAAPRPVSEATKLLFESAMQDVSYIAGGVTTREARGWWHDPTSRKLHPLEERTLVTVLTTRAAFVTAKRRLDALCRDLGDSAVVAWCVEVALPRPPVPAEMTGLPAFPDTTTISSQERTAP